MESNSVTITGRECRFAKHLRAIAGIREDTTLIKEIIHYSDGSTKPNYKMIKNFKRPFYITKELYRNHKDKKEVEDISKVNTYTSTQSYLANSIASRLGMVGYRANSMRDVTKSPYVYGADITSTAVIKKAYMENWPELSSPAGYGALDIETDTDSPDNDISIITVVTKERMFTGILKRVVEHIKDPVAQIIQSGKENFPVTRVEDKDGISIDVPLIIDIGKIKIEIMICDTEEELIKMAMARTHEIEMDYLGVWNIEFDVPHIVHRAQHFGLDLDALFSDPSLPKELRYFKYRQGSKQKKTESGKFSTIPPHEQWHTVDAPARYQFIDAMCAYNQVRSGQPNIPGGYGLDNVLNKNLNLKKLKFENDGSDNGLPAGSLAWHKHMLKNHPIKYIVYNQWDCLSMLELDAKTTDVSSIVPMLAGTTDLDRFNSGPKKIVDALHYYYIEKNRVIGTKPPTFDGDAILGLGGWIQILPAYRLIDNGLQVIEEDPEKHTSIRAHVYDIDAVSSYPSDIQVGNVSLETTVKELISVEGIGIDIFRFQNINLMSGSTNAIEYCTTMLGFPTLTELCELVD